ncbi:MAG: heparinase II/III family protein [Actinomycetota bacterium]
MLHLLRTALSLPPREAARRAARFAARMARETVSTRRHRRRCSFEPACARLARLPLPDVEAETILAEDWLAHRFDLLGSGPVRVAHGETYAGFGRWRYGPGPALPADWRAAVAAQAWPANQARARAILDLIADPYTPIDWHVDFKSGWRWSPRVWGPGTPYAHRPGVDVKVPWELARLQHLPALAAGGQVREVRNQILDFLGANPPNWGVNWACAMDVAIRAANMAVARELLLRGGHVLDDAFEAELAAGILAHGRFIVANLEWSEHHRGNHYLADLAGLAFVAASLAGDEAAAWTDLAAHGIDEEIRRQFLADGGNFEASTAYHRLSLEMAEAAAALLAGLGRPLSPKATDRLARARRFAQDTTLPSGRPLLVGDNDSGRFLGVRLPVAPPGPRPLFAAPMAAVAPAAPVRVVIVPPDPAALAGLESVAYPDFGLYLWRNDRALIALRCGPIGQNGQGGHAHNDQLAVEIEIDGIPFARDPGTFVYTPDLAARNAWRSALAHFVPRRGHLEPARLLAPFKLEDRARAELVHLDDSCAVARHHGFGEPVWRRLAIAEGTVVVEDWPADAPATHVLRTPEALAALWGITVPYAPGYGVVSQA